MTFGHEWGAREPAPRNTQQCPFGSRACDLFAHGSSSGAGGIITHGGIDDQQSDDKQHDELAMEDGESYQMESHMRSLAQIALEGADDKDPRDENGPT